MDGGATVRAMALALLQVAPACSRGGGVSSASTGPASTVEPPTVFQIFSIHHLGGPACTLGLTSRGELYCAVSETDPAAGKAAHRSETFVPSAQEWTDFWAALDAAQAWSWNEKYEGGYDGVSWGIEIEHAGHRVKSEGRNAFPLDAAELAALNAARVKSQTLGNAYDDAPLGARFTIFAAAVKQLSGGRMILP
jgi:hypothetical protein